MRWVWGVTGGVSNSMDMEDASGIDGGDGGVDVVSEGWWERLVGVGGTRLGTGSFFDICFSFNSLFSSLFSHTFVFLKN